MRNVTRYQEDDDGFGGSLTSGRLIKGQILRWNETSGWTDRDGLSPPEVMLVIGISEALQCWKGKKPIETITEKPLPDIEALNEVVPKSEWEVGLDGKPRPPWVHQVIAYLIDPASGGTFTYLNSTIGARMAIDQLREKVITMRALRGTRVCPVVRLGHRPMKTNFGMRHRPEFEVVAWRELGGNGGGTLAGPQTPQLTGPTATAAPVKPDPKPKLKPSALADIGSDVRPVETKEILNDEIPW